MGADIRRIVQMLRRAFARRITERIDLIACRPLHAGGMLYAADFDGRRHVFATTPHAACLLASYPISPVTAAGEDLCHSPSKNPVVCAKGASHEP